ncbi:MAG: hypothetical protein HOG79_07395, partial [Prolixibacteraceae bacterium]|nr:hypothetical protein [Prolixibacteraceae bacterium]
IVHSVSSDPEILSICGINEKNQIVLQLINLKKVPVDVQLDGILENRGIITTTTKNNNWKEVEIKLKKNNRILLDAESVNTLLF